MDPRVERAGMTAQREKQAILTARSILQGYGRRHAMRRSKEIASATKDQSEGNRQFYERVRELVVEGIENGTVNGESWYRCR